MEGKDAHHLELWASVATGLEDDAVKEVEATMEPSRGVRSIPGQVLFAVAASREARDVAGALRTLKTVDVVYCKLGSCGLTDAPKEGDGDRGLRSIRAAAAACGPKFARAVPLWRAMDDEKRADSPAAVFRARGKRGGRHAFSSDDAKRAFAEGLKVAAPALSGSTKAFDLDVLAQVHDNRCWLGLRLNDAPLSDDGEGRRSRGLGARHAAAREQRPKRPPLALTALLKSGDPADVRTAVAPLWRAPYAEQLSAKREALKRALDDLGVAAPPLEPFDAFFADAGASQPRNKLEFHVGADGVVGFRAGDAVLAPEGVPFAPRWAVRVAEALTEKKTAALASVVCRGAGDDAVVILKGGERPGSDVAAAVADAARSEGVAVGSVAWADEQGPLEELLARDDARKPGAYVERVGPLRFRVSAGAFFQTNSAACEILFDAVAAFASECGAPPARVLDACCGGGALGLWLAHRGAARVDGVELCGAACDDAAHNAALNGLAMRVTRARVEDALPGLLAGDGGDLVVVLDPPRTGLNPSVAKALRREPRVTRVVLVSCNPCGMHLRIDYVVKGGSLGNTARLLCKAGGQTQPFKLTRAAPVDLFPHTPHCELVLRFDRVSAPEDT